MSLTLRYLDVPDGAQEAAQVSGQYGQSFAKPEKLTSGAADIPWATLEKGGWSLDGSRAVLADAPTDVGWWSQNVSDENGVFRQPPRIDITFPQPYTATGLTFTFWPSGGQWCNQVQVCWYNGQTLLDQVQAAPSNAQWTLTRTVEGFDKISITLRSTNLPEQFAKLQKIQIGHVIVFGSGELLKATVLKETDPSMCELPVDTMKIQVRDQNCYDLAPQKNQRMELSRDGVLIASQYLTEVSRQAKNLYEFSCQSAIGLLEDTFLGDMYQDCPLEDLLGNVLGTFPFSIDTAFAGVKVSGYLPIGTRRKALQQVAFVIGGMVTSMGDGTIRLAPLEDMVTGGFNESSIFPGARISMDSRVAKVEVYAHSYVPSGERQTLLQEEKVQSSNVLFTFQEPHYDYQITGGTIVSSGINWVIISGQGNVTLTGKTYVHTETVYEKRNPMATAAEMGNVASVQEVTLIHTGNAKQVLQRLYDAQQLRNTLTQDVVVSDHLVGQKVSSTNPWGTVTQGYITSMESTLTQSGHTASVTIQGVEKEVDG